MIALSMWLALVFAWHLPRKRSTRRTRTPNLNQSPPEPAPVPRENLPVFGDGSGYRACIELRACLSSSSPGFYRWNLLPWGMTPLPSPGPKPTGPRTPPLDPRPR
ncbi:hypothetical protein QBC39DRAFT_360480 [Podospora conica]|nr:hypothetical protein QBC39DRAFT_360480 [Schizothecium conicum]